MAFRIEPIATAEPPRQRRPRVKNGTHLDAIRELPCVVCLTRPVEAAHIRSGSSRHGKRHTGAGERPSDHWTIPLCEAHHRTGKEAQHSMNELAFYKRFGIDPFVVALSLWAASGDHELMTSIVLAAAAGSAAA